MTLWILFRYNKCMTLEERFWLKVNKNGSQILDTVCWEWTGKIKSGKEGGYGIISIADYASERRSKSLSRAELAALFNIHKMHIGKILRREQWK